MSEKAYNDYLRLQAQLKQAQAAEDEAKEDEILDAMDVAWYDLTEEEVIRVLDGGSPNKSVNT